MRRQFLLLLLTLFLLADTVGAKLPSHPESVKPLFSGTRGICTTWSVNEQAGYWVTAAHCIVYWADIDGEQTLLLREDLRIATMPATPVKVDETNDLALLQADVHAPAFRLGKYPAVGDEVTVYGYPGGWGAPLPTWLRVSNTFFKFDGYPKTWMVLDGSIWPGHSGSPVLDKKGRVVAVAQAHGTNRYVGSTFVSPWAVFSAFVAGI